MLQKNDYVRMDGSFYRVLSIRDEEALLIDCKKMNMPVWKALPTVHEILTQDAAFKEIGIRVSAMDELSPEQQKIVHERYTMIAGIVALIEDDTLRNQAVLQAVKSSGLSRRTVTTYLCRYLVTGSLSSLSDKDRSTNRELTQDEKNFRWALNKFYYTRHRNKLSDVYFMLLKEKYTDAEGQLLQEHPSIYQFRYYFNKTRKKQTEIISREGIKEYQLNHRPLLGDGVQAFAPVTGTVALDATICDLYLVDEAGKLIGRPIFVAAVDMNCGYCCGYSLLWEGGVYSCRELLLNIVSDKVQWCRKFGIKIEEEQWSCSELPAVFVTDRGAEYISVNFENVAELGCKVITLESFSANMKGPVEKLFSLIQDSFKPYLRGKGVIEPDFQKRGVRDYRKDACLTLNQFEQIIIRCILYHNNSRLLENYPLTQEMMEAQVPPYASAVWNYQKEQNMANLIPVRKEQLVLTLLPRTEGKFTRYGLKVNKVRYYAEGYTEQYLSGTSVTVAYNPDDVSMVFVVNDGYQPFNLIEKRFSGKSLEDVQDIQKRQKEYSKSYVEESLRAKVELAQHIESIAEQKVPSNDTDIKGVRKRRQKARTDRHKDLVKEVLTDE